MKPLICSLFLLLAAPVFVPAATLPASAAVTPLPLHLHAQEEPDVTAQIEAIKASSEPALSTFNRDEGLWDAESNEDVMRAYGPGVYRIRIDAPNTLGWGAGSYAAEDFYAEVETYHVGGSINNEFGFVFRNDGENYYVFGISNDGYFRLQKWLDGEWQSLLPWAESSAISIGEGSHNTLGLLADGPRISLLVNGEVLATTADDSIAGDGLALAVSSFEETGVELAFEDFRLWPLSPGNEVATTEAQAGEQTGEETAGEAAGESAEAVTEEQGTESTGATMPDDEPLAEATPEPLPLPDPELLQTLVEPIRGNVQDLSDDFRRADERWPTAETNQGSISFARRGLNFQIQSPEYSLWTASEDVAALAPADALVEVDVARNRGAVNDTYGLLVRFVDNDNFYYFGISGAGTYSFWRVVADEWSPLVEWTAVDAIDMADDATNRLGVLAQGDRFLLMINDVLVADVTDDTFAAGGAGLYAGTYEYGDLDVTFDNLDVWVLTQGEAAVPVDEQALAAAQARVDEIGENNATYTTRFTRDDGGWSEAADESATIDVARGRLRIDVDKAQWLAWSENAEQRSDFLIKADAAPAESNIPVEIGIAFRIVDSSNFYLMAIDNTGRASLWKKADGQWHALSSWAKDDAIETFAGAENRIGVLAEGSTLSAIVNGKVVASVEDGSFAEGATALVVGSFESPGVSATFDNVSLWELGQ